MKTSLYSTSSWKRQGAALLGTAALLTLCGQSLVYAQLSSSDIAAMKQEIANPKYTFTVDENPATKIPLSQLCGTIPSLAPKSANSLSFKTMVGGPALPSYWDWRQHNGVTPVKDQGACGSCWAFSTVGTMEAVILIASGITTDLSEQQLVSCDTSYYGCEGGNYAFDMEVSPGAMLESCFPYQAADVACQSGCLYVYKLNSWGYVGNSWSVPSTTAIKNAIYTYGPISVGVAVDYYFQAYSGGVYNNNSCSSIDHEVVLVGWDDTNGCWIMKNSWGTGWGESGYMRIAYGCDQIGYAAAYAVWVPPEPLRITPSTGFTSTGGVGGPFTVTSESLSLTNAGTNSLTWTLVNTSLWLNASSSGGTLTPGGPAATVTVSLNTAASNLLVGNYNATVWFTNLNSGVGQGRQFTLAVISPPTITTQPANQAVLEGATATFTVAATGGQPLYYQWQDNGTNLTDGGNISGSTNTSLTINSVSAANIGTYTVIATNVAGIAASSNAFLTITPSAPVIITQPVNQTVGVGSTALFSISAFGSTPFFYQWSFGGTNIVDATNTTLMLTNVQFDQAGNYAVLVTNALGSVISSNAVLMVVPCTPAPSGLVSWWRAEGNANDSIGTNNGTPTGGITYTNGEVGQAFVFNNTTSYIPVPASPGLNVGTNNGFTIEGWIQPNAFDVVSGAPIIEWDSATTDGLQLWTGGSLFGNIKDTSDNAHRIEWQTVFDTNNFQHVALTYDKSSGLAVLYYNGVAVMNANFGSITPQTTYPVNIGRRTGQPIGNGDTYGGLMDELSLYNRALSSNEISAIYIAGSAGKCFTLALPTITSQPANQTTTVGGSATFSVTASGTPPLSYQWNFNGTNISEATNTSLTLTNVQLSQAGNYAVLVTNLYGSMLSSNAVLAVIPSGACTPAPSGLVSWWRAEGNANDSIGTNNGTPTGGITYTNGEVGQAFVFNNTTSYIPVPASPSLNIGIGSGFTIECWIQPNAFNVNGSGAPIVEWDSATTDGLQLWSQGVGLLAVNIKDTSGNAHKFNTVNNLLKTNNFQHVALTYDKSSGNAVLYYNGVAVTNANFGSITPQTTYPMNIGRRTGQPIGNGDTYGGLMDELSLYNRALSSNEIAAIYNAGSEGKCPPGPPSITTQPTNQTVAVGGTATFSVTVGGTPPLSYQWRFGKTNNRGATNTTLILTNVQVSQAGNYTVLVTNLYGSILSSNAVLTVTLDHFAWNPIPSPRFVNTPFAVTLRAQDMTNGLFTNFTGTAILGTTNGIAVTPPVSGNFIQGVWTGAVVISHTASNLVLRADDGLGHFGLANPINVISLPSLEISHFDNTALFMWPVGYSGFVLETSGNLSPATWVVVPYPPIQLRDQYLLPLDMSGTNGFYRLRFHGP